MRLLEIGQEKDITVNLRHIMDFGRDPFELFVLNTNQIVHTMKELLTVAHGFI